jgi:hypothetical protein
VPSNSRKILKTRESLGSWIDVDIIQISDVGIHSDVIDDVRLQSSSTPTLGQEG